MNTPTQFGATELTPILYVRDLDEAFTYYTEKLFFRKLWDWGDPRDFGAVKFGDIEIFLSQGGQGHPGSWLSIFMDDVDAYHNAIKPLGVEIVEPPTDRPWGMRVMRVRDPNQHILSFGHGIPCHEPKLPIQRVPVEVRLEKRLAALLTDLAAHKKMTIGETLEETLLHTFEKVKGGVASPHTNHTLAHIQELKQKHAIDYDGHASYRFTENPKV